MRDGAVVAEVDKDELSEARLVREGLGAGANGGARASAYGRGRDG